MRWKAGFERLFLTPRTTASHVARVLFGGSVLAAIFFLCLYVGTAIIRLRYPYELEWMEGGIVDHVRWILQGHPLYQKPSVVFVPFIYPPVYFYLAALCSKILGVGFFPLRLISFLATIGSCIVLYLLAFFETRRSWFALLAPGFFVATYPLSAYWMDLGRVDSLFLFFLLLSVLLLRRAKHPRMIVLAGVIAILAFFTKQIAWAFYVPIGLYWLGTKRMREAIFFSVTTLLGGGLILFLLDRLFGGWLVYYLFTVPSGHAWEWAMLTYFWKFDVFIPLSILCFFSGGIFFTKQEQERDRAFFYGALLVAGFLVGWLGRLHTGGYENVLLPTYAALSLVAVIGAHEFYGIAKKYRWLWLELLIGVAFVLQWSALFYPLQSVLPSREMQDVQSAFEEELTHFERPAWVQSHGFVDRRLETPIYAHLMAIADIVRSSDQEMRRSLEQELETLLANHAFKTIVLDDSFYWQSPMVDAYYRHIRTDPERFPRVLTGAITQPMEIYVPR